MIETIEAKLTKRAEEQLKKDIKKWLSPAKEQIGFSGVIHIPSAAIRDGEGSKEVKLDLLWDLIQEHAFRKLRDTYVGDAMSDFVNKVEQLEAGLEEIRNQIPN